MKATAGETGRSRRQPWSRSDQSRRSLRPESPIQTLLANRYLGRLVVAFAFVTIAEWGYVTALSVDAFRKNGSIAVGFVGARLFLASISSLFSTAVVSRWPKVRVLSAVAVTRGVGVAGSALVAASGAPLLPLLILLGVDALVSALYRPAQAALIPAAARSPHEVVIAATALSTVKTLSQAIGAVLGGVLLAATSPQAVFAGAAALFGVSAVLTSGLGTTTQRAAQPPERLRRWIPGSPAVVREAFNEVRNPAVAGILVVSGLRTFVRGMWIGVAVIASLRLLHAGSTGVGLLMMAAGVGSLIAAPISSRLVTRRRIGTPAAAALAACGIPLAVIAGVPVFDVAMALVVAWGIGMAVSDVATSSILMRLVDSPLIPSVTGTIESTKLALEGFGGFLGPLMASTIGIRPALLIAAVPLPLVVASGWRVLHHVDVTAEERSALLDLLHGVPCLQRLDIASLDSLASQVTPLLVSEAGVEVVSQGETGDRFYVIKDGSAEVLVDGYAVDVLSAGQSFGERALLRDAPRAATVRSLSPMHLLILARGAFLATVTGSEDPKLDSLDLAPIVDAGDMTRHRRASILSTGLLSHLDSFALNSLADRSVVDRWPAGATIVRQGERGDRYYVMVDGRADVLIDGHKTGELQRGDQFGEIALLHSVDRRADVVTSTPSTTLSLHRDDFVPAARTRLAMG